MTFGILTRNAYQSRNGLAGLGIGQPQGPGRAVGRPIQLRRIIREGPTANPPWLPPRQREAEPPWFPGAPRRPLPRQPGAVPF